jgi:transposase
MSVLGVEGVVVEGVRLDEDRDELVFEVRPAARGGRRPRCGLCGTISPLYDRGGGRRRWRALDLGTVITWLEAEAPRVLCEEHGVVVAEVPWARHGSGFVRAFEDTVAWLATHTSKAALGRLMRIAWSTAGRIIERVVADFAGPDPLDGLRRIGIDEVSHRKGHRYITVVVDHDTGRLVWASPGRDKAAVQAFFDALGPERAAAIEVVTADAAPWIRTVVEDRCPQAAVCMDPFHVVSWATEALDMVRREVWNDARRQGQDAVAKDLKGARYALWKNPEDLTARQEARLAAIERTNRPLYKAYLLKEQLRQAFALKAEPGVELLERWLRWARRCRIPAFVGLARRIARHKDRIAASLRRGLSNGLIESMNTKIRLITRRAFGFHTPQALIALAMLDLGGLCPPLPGRTARP